MPTLLLSLAVLWDTRLSKSSNSMPSPPLLLAVALATTLSTQQKNIPWPPLPMVLTSATTWSSSSMSSPSPPLWLAVTWSSPAQHEPSKIPSILLSLASMLLNSTLLPSTSIPLSPLRSALTSVRSSSEFSIKIPVPLLSEESTRSMVITRPSQKSIPSSKSLIFPWEIATASTKLQLSVMPLCVPSPVILWPFMSIATLLWWTLMQSVPVAVRFFLRKKFPATVMGGRPQAVISVPTKAAEAAGTITPKLRPTNATRVSQRRTVFEIIAFLLPSFYGWRSHDRRIFYLIA